MAESYHHGVRVVEINEGSRAIRVPSTAVLGLVATANDADTAAFPLNTPVLFTDISKAIAGAGETGTLRKALTLIEAQATPLIVVVRVQDDEDSSTVKANVIGTTTINGERTGLQALLVAESILGVKPRILGTPGLGNADVDAALAAVAKKLRGFGYVFADSCDKPSDAINYRDGLSSRELMVIWPNLLHFDTALKDTDAAYSVACAMGLRAQIDNEIGWHKTLSNVGISGVTGIETPVSWDLQDPATDAGLLNENDITTVIRSSGFRFWGSRTCSDDSLFAFENYTRTAQVLADMMAEAHMVFADKPLHPSLAKDILEGIKSAGRNLVQAGYLIGFDAWLDPEANPAENIFAGKLKIDYEYTPVPPLENLTLNQRITDSYLIDFAANMGA